MNLVAHIALLGWAPVVLVLFSVLPPRRAVLTAFIGGWLFLPEGGYALAGLPDYSKMFAACVGTMAGVILFDSSRILALRFRIWDIPVLAYCFVPLASSLTNGLGLYDGLSSVLDTMISWGLPYLIGRLYFSDMTGLRELAIGILIGGLVYVPLCLWEIRMSPNLHYSLYGFRSSPFVHHLRFGGYRPSVFLHSGLATGLWMSAASVIGLWLWATGTVRRILFAPMLWVMPILLLTTVLCKAAGALVLLAGALTMLLLVARTRSSAIVWAAILAPPAYLFARIELNWSARELVSVASTFDEVRGGSLGFRLEHEDRLIARAMQRPLFGWGGWYRYQAVDDDQGRVVTDSYWIITLGSRGLVGLSAFVATLLIPVARFTRATPGEAWRAPSFACAAAIATTLIIFTIDCLVNAMPNPLWLLAAGGLTSFAAAARCSYLRVDTSKNPATSARAIEASLRP